MTDDEAVKELARIRAGADSTRPDEGTMRTPAQVWWLLLADGPEGRLERLAMLLKLAHAGQRCEELSHRQAVVENERLWARLHRYMDGHARLASALADIAATSTDLGEDVTVEVLRQYAWRALGGEVEPGDVLDADTAFPCTQACDRAPCSCGTVAVRARVLALTVRLKAAEGSS